MTVERRRRSGDACLFAFLIVAVGHLSLVVDASRYRDTVVGRRSKGDLREVDETPETEQVVADPDRETLWPDPDEVEDEQIEGERVLHPSKKQSREVHDSNESLTIAETIALEEERARRKKAEEGRKGEKRRGKKRRKKLKVEAERAVHSTDSKEREEPSEDVAAVILTDRANTDRRKEVEAAVAAAVEEELEPIEDEVIRGPEEDATRLIEEVEEVAREAVLKRTREKIISEVIAEIEKKEEEEKGGMRSPPVENDKKQMARAEKEALKERIRANAEKLKKLRNQKKKNTVSRPRIVLHAGKGGNTDDQVVVEARDRASKDAAVKIVDTLIDLKKLNSKGGALDTTVGTISTKPPPVSGERARPKTVPETSVFIVGGKEEDEPSNEKKAPKRDLSPKQSDVAPAGDEEEIEQEKSVRSLTLNRTSLVRKDNHVKAKSDAFQIKLEETPGSEGDVRLALRDEGGRSETERARTTTEIYSTIDKRSSRRSSTDVYSTLEASTSRVTASSRAVSMSNNNINNSSRNIDSNSNHSNHSNHSSVNNKGIIRNVPKRNATEEEESEKKQQLEKKFSFLKRASKGLEDGGDSLEEKKRKLQVLIRLAEAKLRQEQFVAKSAVRHDKVKAEGGRGASNPMAPILNLGQISLGGAGTAKKAPIKPMPDHQVGKPDPSSLAKERARHRSLNRKQVASLPAEAKPLVHHSSARSSFFGVEMDDSDEHCKCGLDDPPGGLKIPSRSSSSSVGLRMTAQRLSRTRRRRRRGMNEGSILHPWSVKLDIRTHNRAPLTCSGSLLNHRYVLTAARCLCSRRVSDRVLCTEPDRTTFDIFPTSLKQIDAFIGAADDSGSSNGTKRYLGTRVVVPRLAASTETESHDYGLLRVDPYVEFNRMRMPICLDGILPERWRAEQKTVFHTMSQGALTTVEGSAADRANVCVTDEKYPKPYHRCVEKCRHTPTPGSLDPFCKEFVQSLKGSSQRDRAAYDSSIGRNGAYSVRGANKTTVCYEANPGLHGWCRVERSSKRLDYSGGSDWGYCSSWCSSQNVSPLREGAGRRQRRRDLSQHEVRSPILDVAECAVLSDKFDRVGEFCAGHLPRSASAGALSMFSWDEEGGGSPALVGEGLEAVVTGRLEGEVGSCEGGERGSPGIQWAGIKADGTVRAIQIGVLSRGLGCPSPRRPLIYSKLAARRAWIMAHIADGGCAKYD